MNDITTQETTLSVSFKRKIKGTNLLVYNLINDCLKNNIPLDEEVLENWYMEKIVRPKNRMRQGRYLGKNLSGENVWENILEYDYFKREIAEKGKLGYYYMADAKQKIKYAIGSLVVRGYLRVLPIINISEIPENKRIENE